MTSPTFTLMRPYPTGLGLDLLHVDVYRLDTAARDRRPRAARAARGRRLRGDRVGRAGGAGPRPPTTSTSRIDPAPAERRPAGSPSRPVGAAWAERSRSPRVSGGDACGAVGGRSSRPIVLAIDTATPQVGVALAGPDGPLASLHVAGGRRHGEVLAPAIERCAGSRASPSQTVDLRGRRRRARACSPACGSGVATGRGPGRRPSGGPASASDQPGHPRRRPPRAAPAAWSAVVDARRAEVSGPPTDPRPAGPVAGAAADGGRRPRAGGAALLASGDGTSSPSATGPGATPAAAGRRARSAAPTHAHPSAAVARRAGRSRRCRRRPGRRRHRPAARSYLRAGRRPRSGWRAGPGPVAEPGDAARLPTSGGDDGLDGAPGAPAPAPPAVGAADRGPGVPPPVVAAAVHERAQPADQPGLHRRPRRRARRRLRRADARRRRGPRHHHRGRPGLAPPQDRHPPAGPPGPRQPWRTGPHT